MNTRSALLLAAIAVIFMVIGYGIAGAWGATWALAIAFVVNFWTFFESSERILARCKAQRTDASRNPDLLALIAQIAKAAEIPLPKVYILPERQPNAFALGRSPEDACLILSAGLLDTLTREELAGVIGHELWHVKNRDILTMVIASTMVGAIVAICALIGLVGLAARENGGVTAIVLGVAGGLGSVILLCALGREREYEADLGGASFAGSADGLIGALQKLDIMSREIPNDTALAHPSTANLYTVIPFPELHLGWLFAMHPPVEQRIARLRPLSSAP